MTQDFVTHVSRFPTTFLPFLVAQLGNLLGSRPLDGEERVLDNWLLFLIYALFALIIPASMMYFSFAFATRPHRRMRARTVPFESGVSAGAPRTQRFTISFYLTAMLFIVFD